MAVPFSLTTTTTTTTTTMMSSSSCCCSSIGAMSAMRMMSTSSSSSRWRRRRLKPPPLRAAVVEEAAEPAMADQRRGDGGRYAIQLYQGAYSSSRDRAQDMQAEARAMARAADASVYSPQHLSLKYGSRPVKAIRRALEILIALGTFAIKLLVDDRSGQLNQNKRVRAKELRRVFTRLGPTFVKLGQGLSTRPDLCPPEYLEELSQLQDALPTFPDEEAFSCIERELGLSLDSIFSSISPSPIAAASLGQVYKAQLKYSGQVVAVKVQRPAIEEAIGLDFYLIRGLGFLINKYVDFITSDVVALIDEFARRVYQELNYVQEGQNARRFKKLYADKEDVLVPDIFWDYTSAKVLTMEWVDGVKLNEQEAIERQGLKLLDLVNTGIQCSLRQLLEYGYFHADPHPGNLLATPEGKLAFLDFGMMSETPEEARYAIIGHVVHMVNRDYQAMARDYYALDFLSPDVDISPIVPALKNFFDDALNSTVSELNFKTIVDGLGAVLYQYPFTVPAYYALILRSLTVLEGLALYADPNFKVLAASYPYFAKRLLTDPNPYLRDALIELLFKDGRFRWNRLENLLVQGRKDRDFTAREALQPVLKLLLGPDGEELRALVVKEAIRVTEAIIVGTTMDTYNTIPDFLRTLFFNGNATGPFAISGSEQDSMLELRDRVFRIWSLLRSSDNFDPALLQPILQGRGYRSKRSSLLTIGRNLVLRASISENKATRRESMALTLMVVTSTTMLGLQATVVASPVVATENWGTRSFIKERFFQTGLSPEDAVARIKHTSEGLHSMRPMLDTMSWRYVIFYIRLKSAYLSSDLKNALLTLPEGPRRASYIKTANELVDNMAEGLQCGWYTSKRGSLLKATALPHWPLLAVLVEHVQGQRDYITEKTIWHLNDQTIKNVYTMYIMFTCWGCCFFGSTKDPFYDGEQYRKDGGDGTGNWVYEKQEDIEERARAELWREELIEEIEQKVGGLRELEEAGTKRD